MLKQAALLFFILLGLEVSAQQDSTWHAAPTIKVSGFADVFYVYDFNQPQGTERQPFLFNHNRHSEFNLNLGFVKLELQQAKYRANFALQTGTYVNDNYAAEPGVLKNIFEANIGISLNRKNTLWLDAGVMPSHIGFESAISMDNWTLTRSLLAENSPYFLTGAKLSYHPNDKLELAALIVNGWQRIQRLQGNSLPSFGTQVNYTLSEKASLNWSTFVGTDEPDSTRKMRFFNNFYGQFQVSEKLGLIAGFDLGAQQQSKGSSEIDIWLSPVLIARYAFNPVWSAAMRAEYYQDEAGVLIATNTANGFRTSSFSLNLDYSPTAHIICRIEGRWMGSEDKIFMSQELPVRSNFIIGTSIAVKFAGM